jgi:hypothetical protein
MGVLSILRNEVEINRCVTVRQHVLWITKGWMFPLRYTWQLLVGNVSNAQRHHWWIIEGVSYTLWDTSWVTVQWGIGLKVVCIDAAVKFCLRLWLVYVRRPPLSVPVLEE